MLPLIVDLDQLCLGGLWTIDGYQRELDSPNSDLLILQRLDSPSVVGVACAWAILEECHITVLAVHPSYRQRGLGQALLYDLLLAAHRRGLERATLEVRVSNQAALSLYTQFGFREAGRRRRYYQDTGEDALILWRSQLQHPSFPQELTQWQQRMQERFNRKQGRIDLQYG
ncbi:ribosomal-protein-alanine N-acetyltransferase [Leptolyngbya sp. 'hensonii']|nr:ribosomal-protein-alanine N-acetyltransferase [Leptolyngbya sp. 'hensonii']